MFLAYFILCVYACVCVCVCAHACVHVCVADSLMHTLKGKFYICKNVM